MNIFLVNHYAGNPDLGMEFRPYYLAKEWVKAGNNVTIVAASFSHLRKKQPEFSENIKIEFIEGIRYVWIKTPSYDGNSSKRFINILVFVKKIFLNSKKIVGEFKPDIFIASSVYLFDIFPLAKLSRKYKSKLIYEIHDLWPLSPMEIGGYSKRHPFIMLLQYAENYSYKKSDAVVSILPKTLEHATAHGLKKEKWFHIPNGIIIDNDSAITDIPNSYKIFFKNLKTEGKFIVGYTGGHADSNALNTLIEAAELLKDENIAFVLVGNGTEKSNLIKLSENLQNVHFLNPVSKDAVPAVLSYFDAGTVGSIESPLYRFGVSPNKIFDYMLAGLPIIQYIKAGNDLVADADCGISVNPGNPKELADAVLKMRTFSSDELKKFSENAIDYVSKNHDYKVLADKFLVIMK